MAGTFFAGTLWNGEILVRNIPASAGSVKVETNGAGAIFASIKLPLTDPETGVTMPFTDLIVPGKCFLAYEEYGVIHNAGPIWTDQYFNDTGTLTMAAAGLWSYFDHRFVIQPIDDGDIYDTPVGKSSTWTASMRTIAKRMVQQCQAWTAGSVPLVFEADFAGTATRTYAASEFHKVGTALEQLSEVIDGPDIAFRPRFQTDKRFIEWVMVTGDPMLTQAGPDHVWDLSVPSPAIKGVEISRNGNVLVTDAYEVGDQFGLEPIVAKAVDATLPAAGYLRFEARESRASVTTQSVLQDHAYEAAFYGRFHEEAWAFSANKLVEPKLGVYNAGDFAQMKFKDNPRVPDGPKRLRIMSYTVNLGSDFVDIVCSPERVWA